MSPEQFQRAVLAWHDRHGRKDLPWQQAINPYRVWVSEIMLQQTQVKTVIPYFERFMARFPDLASLAAADEDEVLHLWTGLGYYSRARNLHRCARQVMDEFQGRFPDQVAQLQQLPGIGRSTAGAIASIAWRQPAAILDGNVKRVLARFFAVEGWPGRSAVQKHLWEHAEALTPQQRVHHYSQAMMDLGATLCTRSKPMCEQCPLHTHCRARQLDRIGDFPGRKPRKALPLRQTRMLIIENQHGEILLQKRPPNGIWAGLWIFPELEQSAGEPEQYCVDELAAEVISQKPWPGFRHTFSHYHLDIEPLHLQVKAEKPQVTEAGHALWYDRHQPQAVGLAAPVKKLMARLPE